MKEMVQKNLERNIDKICLMNFLDGMWFALPVYVIFLLDNGMSLTQIGIILGASSIMPFFFDIPSSVWADKYSRKFVIILSSMAFTLANLAFYLGSSFEYFFIGACFNGIGIALSTGIFSAFVYDTLLSLGKEKGYEKTQAKVVKSFFAGRVVASAFGAYIYSVNPRAVFSLSFFVGILCLMVILSLKEPPREKSISKSFNQIKEGLSYLLKHKAIRNTIIIFAVMGAMCDVLFNFYQPVLKASGVPVIYFGVIYAFVNVSSFLGADLYLKIKSKIDWKNIMVVYLVTALISSLCFGTQNAGLVLLAILILSVSFGSQFIYISSIIHRIVPSSHRATTISINSQAYMISFLIGMNVVSFCTDHSSIFIGMLLNAFMLLVALSAFLRLNYKKASVVVQVE